MTSANRGSRRVPWPLVMVAMLLLGVAAGTGLVLLARAQNAPDVKNPDVVVLVANLYEREKSIFNARERLAFLNRPAVEMADLAADTLVRDRPSATKDIESTRALAEALRQNEREISRQADGGSTSLGVIGVVALSMLIGLTALWGVGFVRGRGKTLPLATTTQRTRAPAWPLATSPTDGTAVLERRPDLSPTNRAVVRERRPDALATGRRVLDSIVRTLRPRPVAPRRPVAPPEPVQERPAAPEHQPIADRFTVVYDIDRDNAVDFLHAILGPNGERRGLCGLSMTESCDETRRYYGLTVWVQQYRDDQLTTVGIVTPNADRRVSARITSWQREMSLSSVIPAHDGLDTRVATDDIAVIARFDRFSIDPDKSWMPDYFSRVSATFEVTTSHGTHR